MEPGGPSRPTSFYSQASTSSCCSVDEGKREVRTLMDSFIADLQRTVRDTLSDDHAAHTPAAPTAARSGVTDTDVEMTQAVPGAYAAEPATGAAPPAEEYIHKGIWCDSCNKQVAGIRHKCLDCYNFDLCNPCMTTKDIQSTHADMPHTFQAMHPPQSKLPQAPSAATSSTRSSAAPGCLCSVLPRPLGCYICKPREVKNKRSARTLTYKCDSCQHKITSTRHKCMTCPDFDLCDNCYSVGFPITDHSPVHRFMHIEDPIRIITAPAVRQDSTLPLCVGCAHDGPRYKCDSCGAVDACMDCLGDIERATIEHAVFHVEQGWDHPVRFTPYQREPEMTTESPAVPIRPSRIVHPADCDACDQAIVGTRHKCTVCDDFDLCDSCFKASAEPLEHKTDHEMLHLDRPMKVVTHVVTSDESASSRARPVSISSNVSVAPNALHRAWCDACTERIRGVRHKCLDCEDFDFCDNCVGKEHFNGKHEFYSLVEPGEIVVRNVNSLRTESSLHPDPSVRSRGRPNGNISRVPIPPQVPAPPAPSVPPPSQRMPRPARPSRPSPPAVHSAQCDMCSSRIHGVRYKCVGCPDYDVCQSCFKITEEVHPGHSFAKVYKQGDMVVRKSPQTSFRHHARCDACQEQIKGIRYKCIHPSCPDYDICERCESLPISIHPQTHAFVKLRSHVANYDGLATVFSFATRGKASQPETGSTPAPIPRTPTHNTVSILPHGPIASPTEPKNIVMEMFDTIAPSPIFPLSTLGCTIVPHTTIVPSLPVSPAPQVPSPVVKAPSPIPSPPPIPESLLPQAQEVGRLFDSWSAASSSAKLDEHVMHHSDMYKPSYKAPVPAVRPVVDVPQVDNSIIEQRRREIEAKKAKLQELKRAREQRQSERSTMDSSVATLRTVTVQEERDPDAPQMVLMTHSRPVSFPSVPAHEPEAVVKVVAPQPVALAESVCSLESINSGATESVPPLLSAYPYATLSPLDSVSVSAKEPLSGASTPVSTTASFVSVSSVDASALSAAFVEDKSIVDGQIVSGGAEFAKCWRMLNDGPTAWPKGTTISFVGGHSMLIQPDMVHWTIAGDFTPGQEIDVEVEMKAPEEPGRYVSYWRLKTPQGEAFGARVWCDIVVAEMERAGSSGSSELSASSMVVPTHAPSMSAVSAPPTIRSMPSTVAPSVVDTADIESVSSLDSDDSAVWDEVRRQAQVHRGRSEGGDGFEVVYESD